MSKVNRVVKSNEHQEETVEPFVGAFNVPKLSDACNILFVGNDALTFSEDLGQMGIVTLQGADQSNIEGVDLLISESQIQLNRLLRKALPLLLDTLMEPIASASVGIASVENERERESIFTARVVEKIRSQQENKEFLASLMPYVGSGIKPVAQLIVANLYKFYYGKYEFQHQAIPDFQNVVDSLRRLSLLSPFLSLALCPRCSNYELVFSRSVRFNASCPKCGSNWPVLNVNEFPSSFATVKKDNNALPLFISAFLKSKV